MNVIKIENFKNASSSYKRVNIKSNYDHTNNSGIMIVLSEDDINNFKFMDVLRGYLISIVLIPNEMKSIFKNTKFFHVLKIQLSNNYIISYY